jgi:sugar phosphate isomerase/epimerase
MEWIMFTKHLQSYSVERAADVIAELGLDGLDLTVRPGGHVEPSDAEARLPGVFRMVEEKGLSVPLLTTGITSADDPYAETIFRLAAESGVQYIKLGYWRYEGFGSMARQIDDTKETLDGIEALAQRYGVPAALHTHSGDFMTASGPVVAELLRDRDPDALVAYADPRHLFAEGGLSGWKMSLDLLSPWIRLIAVKDMLWVPQPDRELGKMRWVALNCPLNVGVVPWPEVFDCLQEIGFDGVVSLHAEYQGAHSWRDLSTIQVIQQTRADLEYLEGVVDRE